LTSFATLPEEDRRQYVVEAANRLGLTPLLVEKDCWVTWTIGRLFSLPKIGDGLVFKGGTSLSKVYRAIARFSEDIDLQITPAALGIDESSIREATSKKGQKRWVDQLENTCLDYVRDVLTPTLEGDIIEVLGTGRRAWLRCEYDEDAKSGIVLFEYPSVLGQSDYLPKTVKLEPGSLADQRPTDRHPISALILDTAHFDDLQCEVVALDFERTFWEKATILHAEYHRPAGSPVRDRSARHYSDFAELWRHDRRADAASNLDRLESVIAMKSMFFPSAWAHYATARPPSLRLAPSDDRIPDLAADYVRMREMFFVEPPPFDHILETLREAEAVVNNQSSPAGAAQSEGD
jgi:hypothetical protein